MHFENTLKSCVIFWLKEGNLSSREFFTCKIFFTQAAAASFLSVPSTLKIPHCMLIICRAQGTQLIFVLRMSVCNSHSSQLKLPMNAKGRNWHELLNKTLCSYITFPFIFFFIITVFVSDAKPIHACVNNVQAPLQVSHCNS